MSKIKQDKISVYALIDDLVYRPVISKKCHPMYGHLPVLRSKFKQNQRVSVVKIEDTNLVSIRSIDGKHREIWYCHGSVLRNNKKVRSWSCWDPYEPEVE